MKGFLRYHNLWLVAIGLLIASLVKILLLVTNVVPFNADEAVVALMARHILNGGRPIFFYGQAYMGSLDSWLVALAFSVFGAQVWVIRAVQGVIFIFFLGTTYWLGKLIYSDERVGMIALWLLVIPTINLTLYTTTSLGGYAEALLIGNLLMITGINIVSEDEQGGEIRSWKWMILGLLAGIGLRVFGITLVFTLPLVVFILWHLLSRREDYIGTRGMRFYARVGLLFLLGTITGAFPWLLYICILTVSAWTWMAHVEQALRDEGLCASRHEMDTPGVDEISVSVDSKSVWQQYHIAAGGWDNPSPTNPLTVVWYPGAARSAYLPPGGVVPTPAPPPVGDTCPIAPCPLRLWTVETLPPGWDPAQIGKPAYEIKARLHTMGNGDSTPVVVRQEPFCAAIGLSPYADGQPRASCPVRPDGHPDRVVVENWLLFGGIVRDSRNGQDCTPHNTDNTAAFLWGTGNCRMCNVPKTACSDWY